MPPEKAKRKTTSPVPDSPPRKQAKQQGSQKRYIVPVEESFGDEGAAPQVHVNEDGSVYDAALSQTNIKNNNNKFYRIQLIKATRNGVQRYWCATRWGRVGDFGQRKLFGPDNLANMQIEFEKKFKDKTGLSWPERGEEPKKNKYTYLERAYDEVIEQPTLDDKASPPESPERPASKLPPAVQSLLGLLFNKTSFEVTLESIGYDSEKLPLGKLGKSALVRAFRILEKIEKLLQGQDHALLEEYEGDLPTAIEELSNQYYSTVPHISPGRQTRLPLINEIDLVKKEADMIDTLDKMEATNDVLEQAKVKQEKEKDAKTALLDQHFAMLKLDELTPLSTDSSEYSHLSKYLNTTGWSHAVTYTIHDIFRVRRHGEWGRFDAACGDLPNSCRRLLWHGSGTSNFGGILSQGLRIAPPEAPVSGYMFGKGVYLADISSKSEQYCRLQSGDHGLLLLCEAELVNPTLQLEHAESEAASKAKEKGCIATEGLGRTIHPSWVDAEVVSPDLKGVWMPDSSKTPESRKDPQGWLFYNEYIVYSEAQVRLRYLIRFENTR